MADRRAVEHLAKRGRDVGRGLGHDLAYRSVWHRLEERVRFGAGLYARAESLSLLFSGFDGLGRRPPRDDQHDRLHLVLEALGGLFFVAALLLDDGSDVLFADLEAFPVSAADQIAPNHIRPYARL